MQRVLITGANGFLGHYLTALLVNDYKVIATGKGPCRIDLSHANFQYESLDFTQQETVEAIFQKIKPDIVVHAGAISKPDDCELNKDFAYKTNVVATEQLLTQSLLYKSFFVYVSTDFVFDGQRGMYIEDDVPQPINYYGETKLLAEKAVQAYSYDWTIVRTVLVYGQPQAGRDNILTIVAKALKEGKTSRIVDDQVRTPTYVEDLAGAIKTIIAKKATGIYHISGKDVLTPYHMTVAVARYLGLNETLIEPVNATTFQQPALRPPKTGFLLTKAERVLGYKPVSFEEGLQKTFQIEKRLSDNDSFYI
jgi:dTDP-4-dehydrorhamnose reductase